MDKIEFQPMKMLENILMPDEAMENKTMENKTMENKTMENKIMENKIMGNKAMENNCIDSLPLAMAYVPMQKWENIYADDVAFTRGTIFAALDLPFMGRGGGIK